MGWLLQFPQPGPQGEQRPGQIAAIDTRHVERAQRFERARVVPVVEMTPVAFELFHRGEGFVRAVEQLAAGEIAEIARRQVGQQGHADVGGRGAGGDHGRRDFLKIVGRQPVLFRVDQHFEVAPCLPGQAAQKRLLRVRQDRLVGDERPADPPADDGRNQPQQQDRPADDQFTGMCQREPRDTGHGEQRRDPHLLKEIGQRGAAVALRITAACARAAARAG